MSVHKGTLVLINSVHLTKPMTCSPWLYITFLKNIFLELMIIDSSLQWVYPEDYLSHIRALKGLLDNGGIIRYKNSEV